MRVHVSNTHGDQRATFESQISFIMWVLRTKLSSPLSVAGCPLPKPSPQPRSGSFEEDPKGRYPNVVVVAEGCPMCHQQSGLTEISGFQSSGAEKSETNVGSSP